MSGTVNIARSLFQDEAFKAQPYTEREAFMWLVMEASWKDRTKRVGNIVVELKRGQLAASIRFMANAWQWEKSTVDRFLKRLEKRDMIGTDCGTGLNVITVCKYNDYQGDGASSGTEENQKRDSSGTAAGQTRTPDAIPDATHKEDKKEPIGSVIAPPLDDVSEAVRAYNETAAQVGWPIVQKMTDTRRRALRSRIADAGGIEGWRIALGKAAQSDFLCGRSPKAWSGCGFDWLTASKNFIKIMEGNYDNRIGNSSTSRRSGMVDAFAAVAAQRSGHS
jgi:hypothetical protein